MISDRITEIGNEGPLYRGVPQWELAGSGGFAKAVFLLIAGRMPSGNEAEMLDTLLMSAADHGDSAPSAHTAVAAASARASLSASVAAGLLTIGSVHGGAAAAASGMLRGALLEGRSAEDIIRSARDSGKRIPGFGHRSYKDSDPRALFLMDEAKKNSVAGDCCRLALETESATEKVLGRRLVLNIDGAHGAILADMGWGPDECEAVFIIARTAGLCAHSLFDKNNRRPLQFLTELQAKADR